MIRNLKVLGLAAVAALAMSAVVASAAFATPGTVEAGAYPATINGSQTNENVLSNGIRSVTCEEASLTGTLTAASGTVQITPSYSKCKGNGNTSATVKTNGCSYTLSPTAPVGGTGTGSVVIDCPAGNSIQIEIWATGKSHNETRLCLLEVPAQGPITGFNYHNVAAGIEITGESKNVRVLRTAGTLANCGKAEQTEGTYNGNVLGTAEDEEGNPISLFVA